jgi:putative hydrolase of the HAD superfamily
MARIAILGCLGTCSHSIKIESSRTGRNSAQAHSIEYSMAELKNGTKKYPRAVCFDLYGTLIDISVDTTRRTVWQTLCNELRAKGVDREPSELHAKYDTLVERERRERGEPFVLDQSFFSKLLGSGTEGPQHAREFGRRIRELTTLRLRLQDYALDVLCELRARGCKLAIVSNTEETVTLYDLEKLDLERYFDTIVISSAVQSKKPEPRIFQIALNRIGVEAADTVFVGDDYESDFRGPREIGMGSVLLCSGTHPAGAPCVPAATNQILEAISLLAS